jgi:hypothetical protein
MPDRQRSPEAEPLVWGAGGEAPLQKKPAQTKIQQTNQKQKKKKRKPTKKKISTE